MTELEEKLIDLLIPVLKREFPKKTDYDKQAIGLGLAISVTASDEGRTEEVIDFLEKNPDVEYDELYRFVCGEPVPLEFEDDDEDDEGGGD